MENVTGEVKATACVLPTNGVRCYLEEGSKLFSKVEMTQPLDGISHHETTKSALGESHPDCF